MQPELLSRPMTSDQRPGSHGVHTDGEVAPGSSQYPPAAHDSQAVLAFWVEYVPLAQLEQVVERLWFWNLPVSHCRHSSA